MLHTIISDDSSFAMLILEQTTLLLPQREIRVLDLTVDMEQADPPPGGVGWIPFKQQYHPVYCLSAELQWLTEVPDERPICAVFEAQERIFGLLCTEVSLLRQHDVAVHEIPAAMETPHSPIQGLALVGDKLACISSAEKLFAYLQSTGAENDHLVQEAL